ncbi:MAG TPA: ABC transporter permease [Candidatus Limnocylindrales bacterium]|nr:ABC transporter permease [Candidatus Limnocylindrales bacterium]
MSAATGLVGGTGRATERPPSRARAIAAWINHRLVPLFTVIAILYLLTPIFVMIAFSFNDPPGRFNFVWGNFSLGAWARPFERLGLQEALVNSLIVGIGSTIVATVLGTLVALALARYDFRGNRAVGSLIFVPMATPEIVMGASLLTLFVGTAFEPWKSLTGGALFPLGIQTILVAHIMFNISYVIVTVRARMAGFDRRLEEAAMDLGANEWNTFWRVTFPLIFPGIMAAALLAFSLSIDDFIITNFTSGISNTFPVWVWSSIRNSLPPQIHVIGTAIFVGAILLVVISTVLQNRSARQAAATRPV